MKRQVRKKRFNVTGTCVPAKDYMVDISEKLDAIKELIDYEEYFTINRGRQYGKTTTLYMLAQELRDEYVVIRMSFERAMNDDFFKDTVSFCQGFLEKIYDSLIVMGYEEAFSARWKNPEVKDFEMLSKHITQLCQKEAVVLMIDEVDKASNNVLFLGFLSLLRSKFLSRREGLDFTFHTVILAGVYDIKNIKLKMINEGLHQPAQSEGKIYNSPWNIAVDFEVDMSFSPKEIETMLRAYENDHQTGMDVPKMAEDIHFYTGGYPVLVSRICKYLDEKIKKWTQAGVREAVRILVRETENPLFRGLSQNLESYPEVYQLLYEVLILGARYPFSITNPAIDLAYRYGYIKRFKDRVKVSNKIFEIILNDYFISKGMLKSTHTSERFSWYDDITRNGRFNMAMCLERFKVHWQELYTEKEGKFFENQCQMIFMTYLKPLLNGMGFYFIESETTDNRRMDLVVIYDQERFILELKVWKGEIYHQKGVEQLIGYMDKHGEEKGYLLTFDFRKNPEPSVAEWTSRDGREIFEVRVVHADN